MLWLAGILASLAGEAIFYLAIGWAASASGGAGAGLILSAITLPRVLLLMVLCRGALGRPRLLAACGFSVADAGVLGIALSPGAGAVLVAGFGAGIGNGLFAAHITPLVLAVTPGRHLSRIQAVFVLDQSLALLLMNNLLGNLAGFNSAVTALTVCAAGIVAVGLLGLASGPLRNNRTRLDSAPA
ncbi:hypothetical protein HCJ76_00665 [Streptomyces sp. MC1]|uniref:hypothetical protein n=1 Tax=Streptomyces sp. MC1 TaxID=295105 RepID=UPI0018CA46FD|nr:hypothetical protein [Streptomyces sp. MC1]MBG7696644.1 hypothetical protein [Streptomyces sp. MC1]